MVPTTEQIKNQLVPRLQKAIQNAGSGSSTDTTVIDLSNYVQKDGDKILSSNDFTNEYKNKVDSAMRFYIGTTQPTDTTVIWLEPIS